MRIILIILFFPVLFLTPKGITSHYHSSSSDRIAFVAFDNDKIKFMTISPDGSNVQQHFTMDRERHANMWDCSCVFRWSPKYDYLLFSIPTYAPATTYIIPTDGQSARIYDARYYQFKWSPDGEHIAYLYNKETPDRYQGELYIADNDAKKPQRFTEREIASFDWSPDGKQIAIASQGDIFITSVEGEPILKRLTTNDLHVNNIAWSPDGTKISYVYRSTLYVVDTKSQLRQQLNDWEPYLQYAWSPDGHRVLANREIVDIKHYSHRTIPLPLNYNESGSLIWSPNSQFLLYGKSEGNIPGTLFLWDLSNNGAIKLDVPIDNGFGYGIRDGVWSPDSKQIAYLLHRQICIVNVDNTNHHCILKPDQYGQIGRLQWSYESGLR